MFTAKSNSALQTIRLGQKIAGYLKGGDIICFFGDLGSGKTTLIKGLAKGLKVAPSKVSSPTFVLMNAYNGRMPLYHFDLYRLDYPGEIGGIGYEEFLYAGDGLAVIEWAQRLGKQMPEDYLRVELEHKGDDRRLIKISSTGRRHRRIVDQLIQ